MPWVRFKSICCLKGQLESALPGAGRVLTGDGAEGAGGYACVGVSKIGVVCGVEGLRAELKLPTFGDHKVFDQTRINAGLDWTANTVEAKREAAQVGGKLQSVVTLKASVDVEPLVDATLIFGQENIFEVAIEDGVAEAKRATGLILEGSGKLPAAGEAVDPLIPVCAEVAAFAEGEFEDSA